MTKLDTIRTILAASAISAATAIAMIAQSGQASAAKSVLHCEGQGSRSVVECCESLVKQNGTPFWMKQAGKNCRTSVKCQGKPATAGAASARYCKIVVLREDKTGNGRPNGGGSEGRGTQTSRK